MNYNTILPPFKWFVLENFPYIEDDFDALTNWQLFCKLGKEMNKIIAKCNLTGEQVENLTNAFNTLKAYVDNYFENLDIQEEVNIKLDEMAESGELADIIAQYVQLQSVLAYDTKSAMKTAENIVEGSICRTLGELNYADGKGNYYKVREILTTDTIDDENIIALYDPELVAEKIVDFKLNEKITGFDTVADLKTSTILRNGNIVKTLGYYSVNDGGEGTYKVREKTIDDTVNEGSIIQLADTNLVAEIMLDKDYVSVNQFGAKGDNDTINDDYIDNAITYCKANNVNRLFFDVGTYKIATSIVLDNTLNNFEIFGVECTKSKLTSAETISYIDIQNGYGHIIHDLGFIGASHEGGQTGIGKTSNSSSISARQRLEHLYFYNITKGIDLSSGYTDGLIIFDVKFQTVQYCINLIHSEGAFIKKITAEPFVKNFIRLHQSNACEISNCIANGSQATMGGSPKVAFIVTGSRLGDGQKIGSDVHIHDIHCEFIDSIGVITTLNSTIENVYLYNGSIATNYSLFYIGNCGGFDADNITLNNIVKNQVSITSGNYDINCMYGNLNLIDIYPIVLNAGNICGLESSNWNPTIHPSSGSGFKTEYHLTYGPFEVFTGNRLFIKDNATPTLSYGSLTSGSVFGHDTFVNNDIWISTGTGSLISKYSNGSWVSVL